MRRPKRAQHIDASSSQAGEDVPAQKYNTENLTPFVKGAKKDAPAIRYSPIETHEQTAFVEQGLINGMSEGEMRKESAKLAVLTRKPYMALSLNRVRKLKARIHEAMKLESERTRPQTKEKQLRRLYGQLRDARGIKDPCSDRWIERPQWSAITRIEGLIAQVEGNFEPLKVDVDVVHREALTNVLTSMTPEQAAQLTASYDKLSALAEVAAKMTGQRMPSLLPSPEKQEATFFQTPEQGTH